MAKAIVICDRVETNYSAWLWGALCAAILLTVGAYFWGRSPSVDPRGSVVVRTDEPSSLPVNASVARVNPFVVERQETAQGAVASARPALLPAQVILNSTFAGTPRESEPPPMAPQPLSHSSLSASREEPPTTVSESFDADNIAAEASAIAVSESIETPLTTSNVDASAADAQ